MRRTFVCNRRSLIQRGLTPDILARARALYGRALELDPGSVSEIFGVALLNLLGGVGAPMDDPRPFDAALELEQALAIDPKMAVDTPLNGSPHPLSGGLRKLKALFRKLQA